MNIGLIKTFEDNKKVVYQAFLDDVYEKNEQSNNHKCSTKYALIKYNKENNHIEYICEATDPYFFQNKNRADNMRILILGKMLKCNREGHFPDKTGIATG